MPLCFHTKKLRRTSRLSFKEVHFIQKTATLLFKAHFGGLEATYTVHFRLIGKLLLSGVSINEAEVLRANINWKSPFLKGMGQSGLKFQVEETSTPTILRVGKLNASIFPMV